MHFIFVFMPVVSFYFVIFIPHTLKAGPWKYCLTWNRSVVQKRLLTAALGYNMTLGFCDLWPLMCFHPWCFCQFVHTHRNCCIDSKHIIIPNLVFISYCKQRLNMHCLFKTAPLPGMKQSLITPPTSSCSPRQSQFHPVCIFPHPPLSQICQLKDGWK